MRVLVVGGGGREHALAWALARCQSVDAVEAAPGNPGTAQLGANHDVEADSPIKVADLAERLGSDLVVVGPEAPLVAGVADELARRGIAVFGPSAAAARIEGSKAFAKQVMAVAGAPTAGYAACTDAAAAKEALEAYEPPYVVKADGLAAGKGVRICANLAEAHDAVDDALVRGVFGRAGATVVIEEFLEGPEVSVFAVADGRDVALLPPAQDFKRALDDDTGPNTGGMGAYTPVSGFGLDAAQPLVDTVFRPVLAELADRGATYRGLLYAGLVLTADGPRLLEFNARFGDPETQVVLPRLVASAGGTTRDRAADLGELLWAAATGTVDEVQLAWHDDAFVDVVLVSGGYPGHYERGVAISGVDRAAAADGATVFHAGTGLVDGQLVTAGGRVLSVVGRGASLVDARASAYAAADEIRFDGLHRRSDIALVNPTPHVG